MYVPNTKLLKITTLNQKKNKNVFISIHKYIHNYRICIIYLKKNGKNTFTIDTKTKRKSIFVRNRTNSPSTL